MSMGIGQLAAQNTFQALADPTRREILMLLSDDNLSIGEISENFEMTRAAVKKHLNILEKGGVISVQKQGRKRVNQLEPTGLKTVSEWLQYFDQFWDARLSGLKSAVETEENKKKDKTQNEH